MLKLGTIVKDKAAKLKGMLTQANFDMGEQIHYLFQPSLINPETKQPVDRYWIPGARVVGGEEVEVDLPLEVLGTEVTDKATGFSGIAVSMTYHINGCVHFDVKPEGTIKKTQEAIKTCDFDIRRLRGKAIKELTEAELTKSVKETPSPESYHKLRDN